MSAQPHEPRVGDTVCIASQDSYNRLCGVVKWVLLPPPWLPEDGRGEEYWVRINMALYNRGYFFVTVPFLRHELLTFEQEVPHEIP